MLASGLAAGAMLASILYRAASLAGPSRGGRQSMRLCR
jgi:hypothetical protein